MKNRNIIKLFTFLWSVLLIVSCSNEDLDRKDGPTVPEGIPVTLTLNVGTPDVSVVETKALENDDKTFGIIKDLAVIVYDEKGKNPEITYRVLGTPATSVKDIHFNAKTGKRKIYVLANVGSIENAKAYTTEEDLLAKTVTATINPTGDEMMLGCVEANTASGDVMQASSDAYYGGKASTIDIQDQKSFSARVIPPYSKITFEIKKELDFDDWATLSITKISLRNLPRNYSFMQFPEKTLSIDDVEHNPVSFIEEEGVYILYMYENRQGSRSNNTESPKDKNPFDDGTGPVKGNGNPSKIEYESWENIWAKKTPCTYIEVEGKYALVRPKSDKAAAGTIRYRFFLGENAIDNFNINRNTNYRVQLIFKESAGYDELQYEWRVQADLNEIAVIPEGQLEIDGSPGMPLPFYLINNTGGDMSVTPKNEGGYEGNPAYGGSDMKFHYSNQSSSDLNSSIMSLLSMKKMLRVGVASVNGGILNAVGHGGSPTNIVEDYYSYRGEKVSKNQFTYKDNYDRRGDVASGLIYRIREYTLSAIKKTNSKPFKVKEYPLLLIAGATGDPTKKETIYAQRIDRVNGDDKREMTESEAILVCPKQLAQHPSSDFGVLAKVFPSPDDFKNMIKYEDYFTPQNEKYYWTSQGLYKWNKSNTNLEKAPTSVKKGYLRCVYKSEN